MKIIFFLSILIIFTSCSFDNKTGIWNDQKTVVIPEQFSKLKSLEDNKKQDLKTSISKKDSLFLSSLKKNKNWNDPFFNNLNNTSNISFTENEIYNLSNKIVNKKIKKNLLLHENKFVFNDEKGIIYIYSRDIQKLSKYNFYKKKIKNFSLELFYIIHKNKIIVSDNLGYVYCIDLRTSKLLWAKFFQIPFNSNIKISLDQIFLANSKNDILVLDLISGKKNWSFATDKNIFKSKFSNNLLINNNNIYLLNTNGSLYSINYESKNLNWILSFKNQDDNVQATFDGKITIIDNNKILIVTEDLISLHQASSGFKFWELKIDTALNPIISNDLIFVLTKDNSVLALETATGNLVWSNDVSKYQKKEDRFLSREKKLQLIDLKLVNNSLYFFTANKIKKINAKTGVFISEFKLPTIIKTNVIFGNGLMYFLDKKNRLVTIG